MLQATVVGNLGSEAKFQSKDGRDFCTFRVAHNDVWTDAAGVQHSNTVWVDCVMNGRPKVAEYLKPGTQVVVSGDVTLRVYSSEKERCMKAGMQLRVNNVQLIGGASDDVPRRLYDENGVQHDVSKWYLTDVKQAKLRSQRGDAYTTDANGWVSREQNVAPSTPTTTTDNNPQVNADGSPAQIF